MDCAADYAVVDYVMEMDEALEDFLSRVMVDRL
jgi:hypothetical protein